MREIVLDTETTGLDPLRGDRLVEIGCVEIFNRMPTGQIFHRHINPERDMPAEAFAVHGLSSEFLADKPLFAHVVDEFLEFIADAPLVIHNASFDISFINAELDRIKRPAIARDRLVDTLLLARRKHPGVSNRLDDLCSRYAIDNSRRTKHGALLDAELLAEVYIDLIGARQSQLILAAETRETRGGGYGEMPRRQREVPLVPRISEEDRAAHRAFIATLGDKPIWNDFLGAASTEPLSSAWPAPPWAAACRSMFWRYRPTKSTGSSIKGGKPPSRTAVAMISRANGNNSRGHSIMTSGCRFSFGTFTMRNTPA